MWRSKMKLHCRIIFFGLVLSCAVILSSCSSIWDWLNPDTSGYSTISQTEAQEILDVFDFGGAMFDLLGDDPTDEEVNAVVDWYLTQVNVSSASVNEEGVVWVQFKCGLLGSLSNHRFADIGYSAQQAQQSARTISHTASMRPHATDLGNPQFSQKRAVIFAPFASDLVENIGHRWWWVENCKTARTGLHQMGYADAQIDTFTGQNASLDAFRTLDRYDFVFILTHGITGLLNQWLVLGEEPTRSSLADRWNGEASRRSIAITRSEGARRYQVSHRFFGDEDMEFPGSVVFLNACTSRKKVWLATALIEQGALSVFGWSNTTNAYFVDKAMQAVLLGAALPHSTLEEAYQIADPMFPGVVHKNEHGDDRQFYILGDGQPYGDEEDMNSSIDYISDFIHDSDRVTTLSLLAWSESRNDLYAIGVYTADTDVLVGAICDESGQPIDVTDIAYSSSEGLLYGISYGQLLRISTEGCSLSEQSVRTATAIGDGLNVLYETSALACDSSGNLYGGTVGGELVSINRSSGSATVIGAFGNGYLSSGDLAFDEDDTLFGTAMRNGETMDDLVTISASTGVATFIGSTGYDRVYGLFFMGNNLCGVTANNELISINTSTGGGTFIRELGFSAWGAQDLGE